MERQPTRRLKVAGFFGWEKLRCGQANTGTIQRANNQEWAFRTLTGTGALIPFFTGAWCLVAALDIQHLGYSFLYPILTVLSRFVTVQSAD